VLSRNGKIFAVSSLVLNLFASQIGEFFLPHSVDMEVIDPSEEKLSHNLDTKWRRMFSRFISDESTPNVFWIDDSVGLREGQVCVG